MELSIEAVRVLGCLVEKQMTTPDVYPMSLNSIVTAANQSTNRDPVMSLNERAVVAALDELRTEHRLVRIIHAGAGSRVDKYRHGLDERLGLTPPEMAVLAMLALRGPQTVAEVKARTERMVELSSEHIERVVERLCDPTIGADPDEMTARAGDGMIRSSVPGVGAEIPEGYARAWDGPLVVRLPRQPGQKEPRITHLLRGPMDADALAAMASSGGYGAGSGSGDAPRSGSAAAEKIAALEARVAELETKFAELHFAFEDFRRQF